MADITTTFDGDGRPLENVIGRLSKEFRDFAKTAQNSFDVAQRSVDDLSDAGKQYNRVLDEQISKIKKLESASRIQAPGTSALGLSDDQVRSIQSGLSDSTREATRLAREFTAELERASKVRFSDDQVRDIQSGLSESRRQASELAKEITEGAKGDGASVDFLKQQVDQYNAILEREKEINKVLDERLSKSKEIELAAKPQDTSSQIGLTEEQVRRVQAALAESPRLAQELTEEFLKQNAALKVGTDLVKRTGSEIVKAYGTDLVKRTGSEIVKYAGEAAKKTASFAKETGIAAEAASRLKGAWDAILSIPDLPSLRYALYDIANTFNRISAAASAFGLAPIGFSIRYEREFANVIRTNEVAGDSMRETRDSIRRNLQEISQSTPISWKEITDIATLGGQLGIATDYITEFTEVTAKFAATTNLTVQGAATAFGRLNQLIRGVDGNFQGLGSAILAVGVSSVATESEIVNVSTQIASMGNLAGLTAAEIVGLSGAMASLGIRPELARGTITRLFSQIGKSAADGGYNIQEFGRLTGRTAEEFVRDWETRPGEVLQDFFEGINNEGPRAERTLRQLGITSVRDIPSILRLAQNTDEVRRIIALSSDEYAKANKVAEQYGIISGTTAEQINRLGQNFELLQAAIGDSVGPLALLFQFINNVVQGMTRLVQTPVGQFLSAIAIILALVVAALTALIGSFAGAIAATIAWRFASRQLGVDLITLIKSIFGSKAATDALTASAVGATKAMTALRAVMRTMIVLGLVTFIAGLILSMAKFGDKTDETNERIQKFFGGLDGLREAIEKDTEAFDEQTQKMQDGTDAILTYETEIKKATEATRSNVSVAGDFVYAQEQVAGAVDTTTAAVEKQTRAIGANTLAFMQSKLLEQGDLVGLLADPNIQQLFVDTGITINDLLAAGIRGEADVLVDALVENAKAARSAVEDEMLELQTIALTQRDLTEEEQARLQELNEQYDKYAEQINILNTILRTFLRTQKDAIDASEDTETVVALMNDELDEFGEKVALARDELDRITQTLFGFANYAKRSEDALYNYAEALALTGDAANEASGEIQGVIAAILTDPEQNVDNILANLYGLLVLLEQQGPQTAAAQQLVRDAINEVAMEAGKSVPDILAYASALQATITFDPNEFAKRYEEAMNRVSSSSRGAAREVKSLNDQLKELIDQLFESINAAAEADEAIFRLGEAFAEAGDRAFYGSREMQAAIKALVNASETGEEAVANLSALLARLANTSGVSSRSLDILRQVIQQVGAQAGLSAERINQLITAAGGGLATISMQNFRRGVESVAKEVRTLVDYASDLSKVISRAFDIRYTSVLRMDRVISTWRGFAETIENARDAIEDLIIKQRELTADRAIKQYFLSIAEAYGDSLRADKIRAELEKIDKDLADNARELAKRTDEISFSTEGNSDAAIRNRKVLTDLISQYQDYIDSLASSGASQDELRRATERARQEFIQQARDLGFAERDIQSYAAAFDDVRFAIDRVPRNVTIEANVNPAITALREMEAQLERNIRAANDLNRALNQPVAARAPSGGGGTPSAPVDQAQSRREQLDREIQQLINSYRVLREERDRLVRQLNSTPVISQRISLQQQINSIEARMRAVAANELAARQERARLATGGYISGPGGPTGDKIPALLSDGEYVVKAAAVSKYGRSFFEQLNQMKAPMFTQAPSAATQQQQGNGGVSVVELSPYDRKLLAEAGNVQLSLNGKVIAQATNTGNVVSAQRGSN